MTSLAVRNVNLTPKEDRQGVRVTLKVFWKTTKFWRGDDVVDFQKNVPEIAGRLRAEKYWNKDGDIQAAKFTCEDFAIRVLCEYAAPRGLPVKLTTGVRVYRNMELYDASEHDRYASNVFGFCDMVMLSFGAPEIQRVGVNTVAVMNPKNLLPGDILAQALDRTNSIAHHIQVVEKVAGDTIRIVQGNSSGAIFRPITTIMRLLGANRADPRNGSYAGMQPETGEYTANGDKWDYTNLATNRMRRDFLRMFQIYRWNFIEFNK